MCGLDSLPETAQGACSLCGSSNVALTATRFIVCSNYRVVHGEWFDRSAVKYSDPDRITLELCSACLESKIDDQARSRKISSALFLLLFATVFVVGMSNDGTWMMWFGICLASMYLVMVPIILFRKDSKAIQLRQRIRNGPLQDLGALNTPDPVDKAHASTLTGVIHALMRPVCEKRKKTAILTHEEWIAHQMQPRP